MTPPVPRTLLHFSSLFFFRPTLKLCVPPSLSFAAPLYFSPSNQFHALLLCIFPTHAFRFFFLFYFWLLLFSFRKRPYPSSSFPSYLSLLPHQSLPFTLFPPVPDSSLVPPQSNATIHPPLCSLFATPDLSISHTLSEAQSAFQLPQLNHLVYLLFCYFWHLDRPWLKLFSRHFGFNISFFPPSSPPLALIFPTLTSVSFPYPPRLISYRYTAPVEHFPIQPPFESLGLPLSSPESCFSQAMSLLFPHPALFPGSVGPNEKGVFLLFSHGLHHFTLPRDPSPSISYREMLATLIHLMMNFVLRFRSVFHLRLSHII